MLSNIYQALYQIYGDTTPTVIAILCAIVFTVIFLKVTSRRNHKRKAQEQTNTKNKTYKRMKPISFNTEFLVGGKPKSVTAYYIDSAPSHLCKPEPKYGTSCSPEIETGLFRKKKNRPKDPWDL